MVNNVDFVGNVVAIAVIVVTATPTIAAAVTSKLYMYLNI